MNKLHDSTCNTHTVKSTCTTSNLIQNNQTVFSCVSENLCNFIHFYHECTLTSRQIVTGTDTGKNLIYRANSCLTCGNKAAHLCHQDQQSNLAHIGRFTCHIRSGNNNHTFIIIIDGCIIRNENLAIQQTLYNRMTTVINLYFTAIIQFRTHIVVFKCYFRQRY